MASWKGGREAATHLARRVLGRLAVLRNVIGVRHQLRPDELLLLGGPLGRAGRLGGDDWSCSAMLWSLHSRHTTA